MFELPPLSLYVHIPWCVRKCPYCDFNSHAVNTSDASAVPEWDYLERLKQDFDGDLEFAQGRPLQSIFFGGGTPSLMTGAFYEELLKHIARALPFAPDIEITLEANPGTTDADRFKAYYQAGINRLSVGVQSFQSEQLQTLGRIHSGVEARTAIAQAKAAGFTNVNIDLMHGLPRQTVASAVDDLAQALALEPTHLSWYQLTVEPNTEYFRRPPPLPDDDTLWEIQTTGIEHLRQHQFAQYEVSAFAQAGRQARHNLNYWHFGDYLGIGAGAHAKVSCRESGRILRYRKTRLPKDYLQTQAEFRIALEPIPLAELGIEFLMNALRLNQGVDERLFTARTGLDLATLEPQLSELRSLGLMTKDRLQASAKGHLFLNTVLERFANV